MLTRKMLPKLPIFLTHKLPNTFTKKASELLLENKPDHPWIIFVVNDRIREQIQREVDKINNMTPLEKEAHIVDMLRRIVNGRGKSSSRGGSTQRKRSTQKGGVGIVALASLVVLGIATLWSSENTNQTHIEQFGIRYELVAASSPIAVYISSDFDNREFIKDIDLTKFKHAADIAKMTVSGKHLFDAAQIHFYICLMETTGMFTKKINSPTQLLSYSESSQTSKEIVKVSIKDIIPTSKSSFNPETFVADVKEELVKGSADKIDKTRMDVIESWLNILKHHNNINDKIDMGVIHYVMNVLDKKYSYMDESSKLQVTAVFILQLYEHNKKNGLKISQEINSQLLETTQKVAKDAAASGNKEKFNYYIYLYICIYAVISVIDYYVDFESLILPKTIKDKSSPINTVSNVTAQTAFIPLPGMEGYDSPVDQSNDNKEYLKQRMERIGNAWGNKSQTNSVTSQPTRGWAKRDDPNNTIERASQHKKEDIKADLGITSFGSTPKRAATPKKGK